MRPDQFQALVEEMQLEAWTGGVEQERKRCIDVVLSFISCPEERVLLRKIAEAIEKGEHGKG